MRYLLILLAGCAPLAGDFTKQGASHEEMLRDHAECRKGQEGMAVFGAMGHGIVVGNCMKAKGWTERQ